MTGSSGLIGSEAVEHYCRRGADVHGIDNNMRREFFGPEGDTSWNLQRLNESARGFVHHDWDIRDRDRVDELFRTHPFELVVHCAAQPSHDRAAASPLLDFDVNATGTINLLEATRIHAPEAIFVYLSTNKVYGDAPNELELLELPTRWDYAKPEDWEGIRETMRVDQSTHSLFGASKLAGDVMSQEYGRYFGLRTGIFRGGCLTGRRHSGVEQHGFLSYLVRAAVRNEEYVVYGYKGKQVRDQIHSVDVVAAIEAFTRAPRAGEVYNLGGGRENSASILECIELVEHRLGRRIKWRYDSRPRKGDHICYISDLGKLRSHFPQWTLTRSLPSILDELVDGELARLGVAER